MSRFQLPPKGSTIYRELMKGRICERTGTTGRATILWDPAGGDFVVLVGRNGRERRFKNYRLAIRHFNICVGWVKALHPPALRPAGGGSGKAS
jgi:hypothetical protein